MWCLLSKLGETSTSFNLLLHLIPKSDGLYYPGVTSESLYCSSCGYCLKNRGFLNCVNILMIYHVLHNLILRTRKGTIVLHLMWGLGPKVRTQVTTTYIRLTFKVPRKAHLPFLNLPHPAAGFPSGVRVWALSSTETAGLYLGATLCQNRCVHVHVCDHLPVPAYYFVGVSSNFRIIPSEQDSNATRGTEIKWENTWCMHFIGEGDCAPLQYSCLENPMGGGAWWAVVHGVAKSWTQLSDFTFTFHFLALEKEMATHSSVLARRSLVGCRLWGRRESDTTEAT